MLLFSTPWEVDLSYLPHPSKGWEMTVPEEYSRVFVPGVRVLTPILDVSTSFENSKAGPRACQNIFDGFFPKFKAVEERKCEEDSIVVHD